MSGSEQGRVRLEREGTFARIVFDRPRVHNAVTPSMYGELESALDRLGGADEVRVVVFRGAGGHFVAGTDISRFTDFESGEDGLSYEARLDRVLDRLERLRMPTLAVVEGWAAGGGMALAAACDLRICTAGARFAMPIARTVGNCLSMDNYTRLAWHLGPSRTKALLFLADHLSAEEAREAGFVLEVVEPDRLDERVAELCRQLASHAPLTMWATKEALLRIRKAVEGEGDDLIRRVYGSRDFQEGVQAFLEKRDAEWEGW